MLAQSFTAWYWTFKKSQLPSFTVLTSIKSTVTYHMGTAMAGALVITLLTVLRWIIQFILSKSKSKCSIFYCLCYQLKNQLETIQKIIKCLNRNAYIICALHGKGFFASAKYAVNILLRNGVETFTLIAISKLVIFMSKFLITLLVGLVTYYSFCNYSPNDTMNTNEIAVFATVVMCVLTYYGACIFFTVHLVAIDTLFLCFLEDYERNDGSESKPYFMPKALMKIIHLKKDELEENLI